MPPFSRAPTADDRLRLGKALAPEEGSEVLGRLFGAAREWIELYEGDVLVRQGDQEASLYFLVEGSLEAWQTPPDGGPPTRVATVEAAQVVGEMQLLMGGVRSASLRAVNRCLLVRLAPDEFEAEAKRDPDVTRILAARALHRLRRERLRRMLGSFLETSSASLVDDVASQADWLGLAAGDVLVREGEPGGDVFILVEGRLRATLPSASDRVLGDLVPGDVVGETQMFTGGRRHATVTALRDSTLARLPRPRIEAAIRREPELGLRLASIAVERALRASRPAKSRRRGVNVVVVGEDKALQELCAQQLSRALGVHGETTLVTRSVIARELGQADLCDLKARDPRAIRLEMWLSDLEARDGFLVFVTDSSVAWRDRCLSYADIVLRVTTPGVPPDPAEAPALAGGQARQWLAIIHEDTHDPNGTAAWSRLGVARFFHARKNAADDFARLARAVAGREVGLVLGGGGARGYAHLGTIRALAELGIPIDVLGGTSAGAAVGSYYALGLRDRELEETLRRVLGGFVDYTLPLVSISAGGSMLRRTRKVYGSLDIEDLALPFFCVATDITRFGMLVIDRGPVTDAVLASACLPGIFPPVNVAGRWAVDGGLVNALPVDIMRGLVGPSGVVIASDVTAGGAAPLVDSEPGASGVSGWTQLLRTLQGRRAHPTIADTLQRSATAAGDHQLQQAMASGYPDVLIRHDTVGHSVVDFSRPGPLREKGYTKSMEMLRPLLAGGVLPIS